MVRDWAGFAYRHDGDAMEVVMVDLYRWLRASSHARRQGIPLCDGRRTWIGFARTVFSGGGC